MAVTNMTGGSRTTHPHRNRNRLLATTGMLAAVVALGWAAIGVTPTPFPAAEVSAVTHATVVVPQGLPAPVERFYRQRYGEQVPLIESLVISGRGTMRVPQLFDLELPVRFRFWHEAGVSYRHYIEVTLFGLPALKVNEYFVDGKERQELPWAVATDNVKLDQGGNLGMWAELIEWAPSVLLTDARVRWEAVDAESAFLVVPFGDDEERFLVRFSPTSDDILYWGAMRYANVAAEKSLWVNGTWFDDGRPWFVIHDEQVLYNVAVETATSAKGP